MSLDRTDRTRMPSNYALKLTARPAVRDIRQLPATALQLDAVR
jgi:hypothetical protein